MTRSVIVPQGEGELLGRERHHAPSGIDTHVELIEKIAPEDAVGPVDRQVLRAHGHAPDPGLTDLEAVDEDELHLTASRRARHLRPRLWSRHTDSRRLE